MSFPIRPVGPMTDPAGIAAIDRSRKVREEEPRDEDERRDRRPPRRRPKSDGPPVPDASGHIDVLA